MTCCPRNCSQACVASQVTYTERPDAVPRRIAATAAPIRTSIKSIMVTLPCLGTSIPLIRSMAAAATGAPKANKGRQATLAFASHAHEDADRDPMGNTLQCLASAFVDLPPRERRETKKGKATAAPVRTLGPAWPTTHTMCCVRADKN